MSLENNLKRIADSLESINITLATLVDATSGTDTLAGKGDQTSEINAQGEVVLPPSAPVDTLPPLSADDIAQFNGWVGQIQGWLQQALGEVKGEDEVRKVLAANNLNTLADVGNSRALVDSITAQLQNLVLQVQG